MTWLQPAIIASIASSLIITLTYIYIYFRYKQINFIFWSIAWILGIARFVTILIMVRLQPTLFTHIINELFSFYNAVFLVLGVSSLINNRQNKIWLLISTPFALWIIIATLLKQPFLAYTIPAYLLVGIIYIYSGIFFIRGFKGKGKFNTLVGVTLILHGLHKFDYPFLRNAEAFAPYGFLINSMFTLLVAFGFVLIFFEQEHIKLQDKENMLRSLFSQSPLAIVLSDQAGNAISINDKFTELLGYTYQDINTLEKWTTKAYPQEDYRMHVLQDFQKFVGQLTNNSQPEPRTFKITDKWGKSHIIEFHFSLVSDNILFVLNDLTEKKRMEEELLNIRKLESLGVLTGGIAHDFNNLLTGILGNLELALLNVNSPVKTRTYIQNSRKAVDRASALTSQLLTFSKKNLTQTEALDISSIIAETVEFVLSGSECAVELKIDADLWNIEANKGQISQVMHNLILNARQAMPGGGTIIIKAQNEKVENSGIFPADDYIKTEIIDQGPGVPLHIIDKIFDPYFSTKKTGSGLGLASCYSIIKGLGGHIQCTNNPDKGCTFTIHIPAAQKKVESNQVIKSSASNPIFQDMIVMIIDDDIEILKLLEHFLKTHNIQVLTFEDGNTALKRLETQNVDIIITDLTIPGKMGGLEFKQELLNSKPDIPVILMSGYAKMKDPEQVTNLGFAAFIQKPFNLQTILDTINQIKSKAPLKNQ